MTRVILSLQATHTALEALRRNELSCAVAAQVMTENRRAAAKPAHSEEGGPFLPYGTSAAGSWLPCLPIGGTFPATGLFGSDQGKDLCFYPLPMLGQSFKREGGP